MLSLVGLANNKRKKRKLGHTSQGFCVDGDSARPLEVWRSQKRKGGGGSDKEGETINSIAGGFESCQLGAEPGFKEKQCLDESGDTMLQYCIKQGRLALTRLLYKDCQKQMPGFQHTYLP